MAPGFHKDTLKDQVILVTGGGTGLGRAMVERFLDCGAKVAISGRREEVLSKVAEELAPKGEVLPVQCDVRDIHQVDDMVESAIARFGRIDGLVNNAAANFVSPTDSLSPNAFRVIIDTVLMGSVNCTLTLGKIWLENKQKASVLNIVAGYATNGSNYVVPSAAAKAGVQTLTRSLAVEWGRHGIRFNAISPGQFPTEGAWDRLIPENLQAKCKNAVPLGRFGESAELADLAVFLFSDLSGYINGEVIHIDGGLGLNLGGEFNFLDSLSPGEWKDMVRKARLKK